MYNRVTLIGRLTEDPELRYTPTGIAVVRFRLAVNRPKRSDGTQEADFIPVSAFRKVAVSVAEYCRKGRLVLVDGSLRQRQYETESGEKRTYYEVLAGTIRFLPDGRRQQEENGEAESTPNSEVAPASAGADDAPPWDDAPPMDIDITDDDLPF